MKERIFEWVREVGFPEEDAAKFEGAYDGFWNAVKDEPSYTDLSEKLLDRSCDFKIVCEGVEALGERKGFPVADFNMLFMLSNFPRFYDSCTEEERELGIFIGAVKSICVKYVEFADRDGEKGVKDFSFLVGFFRKTICNFGRLELQENTFNFDDYEGAGIRLTRNDPVVAMHISSSGRLTKELRIDSLKKGYRYFAKKGYLYKGLMPVCAYTWLLHDGLRAVFAEGSNLNALVKEFTPLFSVDTERFIDGWRIFGYGYNAELKNLPTETTLQKRILTYLENGGKVGLGYGILLFDGEKILE